MPSIPWRSATRRKRDADLLRLTAELVTAEVPPLIDQATFDAAETYLDARAPNVTPARIVSGPTLLTGRHDAAHWEGRPVSLLHVLDQFCSEVASPAGFEPTTPGLGILCSILLSYGDGPTLIGADRLKPISPANTPLTRAVCLTRPSSAPPPCLTQPAGVSEP